MKNIFLLAGSMRKNIYLNFKNWLRARNLCAINITVSLFFFYSPLNSSQVLNTHRNFFFSFVLSVFFFNFSKIPLWQFLVTIRAVPARVRDAGVYFGRDATAPPSRRVGRRTVILLGFDHREKDIVVFSENTPSCVYTVGRYSRATRCTNSGKTAQIL